MNRVFLDTNIFLDVALHRDEGEAESILNLGDEGYIKLYASSLTFANIAYILRKHDKSEMYQYLKMLRAGIEIIALDSMCLDNALDTIVTDFEDMLQYQCALSGRCDCIITNNTKHFKEFCELPLFTSKEFVQSKRN